MAAAPEGSGPGAKPVGADPSSSSSGSKEPQKPTTALEEDDEFEDFPIDGAFSPLVIPECFCSCIHCKHATDYFLFFRGCLDWPQEETEVPGEGGNTHLWEESWDDDDTSEDFSKQLK